mgnify:CR=1 FL=1
MIEKIFCFIKKIFDFLPHFLTSPLFLLLFRFLYLISVLHFPHLDLILGVQAAGTAEYRRKEDFHMERKTDKELAVEATIEYIKSWNAAAHTSAATSKDFVDALKEIYSTIRALDDM